MSVANCLYPEVVAFAVAVIVVVVVVAVFVVVVVAAAAADCSQRRVRCPDLQRFQPFFSRGCLLSAKIRIMAFLRMIIVEDSVVVVALRQGQRQDENE